ncbi:calcium-translocating P-type ATPase, PMCA-type [Bacteroidota bacterium]
MKYTFKGLTSEEARLSREQYGSNELAPQKIENFWDKLRGNFKDPIIIILIVALIIIFILSVLEYTEWYEAVSVAAAVLLSVLVSTLSEFKNEQSFQKLQEEASKIKSRIFRDNDLVELVVNEVVVGDYILLQAGDKVPADGRLVSGDLKVNQASLTGESQTAHKIPAPEGYEPEEDDFSDKYLLFRGSVIDEGEGVLEVDKVGDDTFYGQLAQELSVSEERLSPLQVKLADLAKMISRFGYIAATLIAVAFMFNKVFIAHSFDPGELSLYFSDWLVVVNDFLDAIILAIIIVVAAVPEGLPMMIAIVLSLNMRKMLKAKVLVRKLLGIETSGSINILFSDKTGTITKGMLEPRLFIIGNRKKFNGYEDMPKKLQQILNFSILENTSCVISPQGVPMGGNMSERAIVEFVDSDDRVNKWYTTPENEKTILFNSTRKFSATQVKQNIDLEGIDGPSITIIKGASEFVMEGCHHFYDENGNLQPLKNTQDVEEEINKLEALGIRFITIAISDEDIREDESLPGQRVLVGVMGIRDEIREQSSSSIATAHHAGIQVVMITGDQKGTATAIAHDIGLTQDENDGITLTSTELNQKSDEELSGLLPRLKVVARALPTDKSRLVRIVKSLGKVAGMTGDGVNDSAALKKADVGFAMGSGSEVAKEASDIVILDDNFASITNAVLYGRTIFKSIRKFIIFQLTVNVAAVLTVFIGPFIGVDYPLTIIQLLWINIIMDTLAAMAFGGEPALERYMEEKPIIRKANILTKDMISEILSAGLYIAMLSVIFLSFEPLKELFVRDGQPSDKVFYSAFYNLFILLITFNAFNARTEKTNLLEHINENKGFMQVIVLILFLQVIITYVGGSILRSVGLLWNEWLIVVLIALTIIPFDLLRKTIRDRYFPKLLES